MASIACLENRKLKERAPNSNSSTRAGIYTAVERVAAWKVVLGRSGPETSWLWGPLQGRDCGARAEQVYKSGVCVSGGSCRLTPEIGWSSPRQEKPGLG